MKLAVTMISYEDYARPGKMTVAQFIDKCSELGVDAVDIVEYFWQSKEKEVQEVPGLLKEKGLDIGAFCIGNNFIVPADERDKQIEYVKEGIRTAVKLGAPRLRIFGGSTNIPEGINPQDRIGIIVESIGKCIDYAKENNITFVLENHGGVPVTSCEMLEVLNAVNSPYLKVNFDIGNFLSSGGEDPLLAAEKLYPYIDHIHAKDLVKKGDKYVSCITGEGIVPIKECLALFAEKGFDGYVSLEYEAWETCESMAGVPKSIEYLKKVLKEI